jgi:hypothetical protein
VSCPTCGRELDAHERHERFTLPERVLRLPDRERTPGSWLSHEDAVSSVMMQVPGAGAFVRCLLPVHLTGGASVTFGVWLAVSEEALHGAFSLWWAPEYPHLVLSGRLGNVLPGWGLLDAPVQATVEDPDQTPWCTSSPDPELHRVLTEEWPQEEVLARVERGV